MSLEGGGDTKSAGGVGPGGAAIGGLRPGDARRRGNLQLISKPNHSLYMPTYDPRVDAYIAKAPAYAQPILEHLRELVHKACPDVEEAIKWGCPHFGYMGGPMCHLAAFKQHCKFGFWKAGLMKDAGKLLHLFDKATMGNLRDIASLGDLPGDKVLLAYIKEACRLNEEGIKAPPRAKSAPKKALPVPPVLAAALKKNKKAAAAFEAFAPSHRREYILWITEAKTEETRDKRVNTAIEWIAEGKGRNWKYEKK
jgi:uncharacterized protein YdeI (YjbR/CyaY-like superfamily)